MENLTGLFEFALLVVLVPLWLLSGTLDTACHRRLRIEQSSGTPESLLHLTMLLELGIGISAALLLELNATAFLIMYVATALHEVTMWLDLAYAETRRRVPWFEQLVHGLQQVLPWVALAAVILLHPAQALSVFGLGSVHADWRLMLKRSPLPSGYLISVLSVAVFAVVGPLLMEYVRCRRAARARHHEEV